MSTEYRQALEQNLDQAIQDWGNLNVLFTHTIASHVGLSATEFEATSLLKQHGPMTAGELAKRSGLTTGAITGLIDRFERHKLAERYNDPTDRRRVMIRICPDPEIGRKIRALYRPVADAFNDIVATYSDEEVAVITRFINESMQAIDTIAQDMRSSTHPHGSKKS